MIAIIDFGVGNLGSVYNMVKRLGHQSMITSNPEEVLSADKIIIPGVGSFDNGMNNINERGLLKPLTKAVLELKKPVLGICLGMQLMSEGSDEGNEEGLSWIPLRVKGFRTTSSYKGSTPVMGWNYVVSTKINALVSLDRQRFYFVHSYYFESNEYEILTSSIEEFTYCAAFQKGNIYGVQFHPEKSHQFGLELMKRFCSISI